MNGVPGGKFVYTPKHAHRLHDGTGSVYRAQGIRDAQMMPHKKAAGNLRRLLHIFDL